MARTAGASVPGRERRKSMQQAVYFRGPLVDVHFETQTPPNFLTDKHTTQ
jgi:hypothetical protein